MGEQLAPNLPSASYVPHPPGFVRGPVTSVWADFAHLFATSQIHSGTAQPHWNQRVHFSVARESILRPFEADDLASAHQWFGDAEVMRYTPMGPDQSREATRERSQATACARKGGVSVESRGVIMGMPALTYRRDICIPQLT